MEMNQYLEVFIEESKDHLQNCNTQMLELEKNPGDIAIVNEIFRSAHTLKGMSATMGYEDLASLTHNMENVLDDIRNGKLSVTTAVMDALFSAVDDLEDMTASIASGGDGKKDVSRSLSLLEAIQKGEPAPKAAAENNSSIQYDEFERTVIEQSLEQGYIAYELTVKLKDDCLLKAARVYMVFEVLEKIGEVIKSNPTVDQLEEENFDQHFCVTLASKEEKDFIEKSVLKVSEVESAEAAEVNLEAVEEKPKAAQEAAVTNEAAVVEESAKETQKQAVSNKTIRVNIDRLDVLMNLFEELVIDRGRLEQISKELNHGELNETVERMSRISGDLQSIILTMRMVPVETVFNRFPRMVRQLARDLDKQISLEISGQDTELDRTVIDEIGDPLVHLLRNALDHGIESPAARREKGKPEEGTIQLRAYHSGNHVFIEIEDDGAGISKEKVLSKALSRGIVTEEQAKTLTDSQVYELIMASGFSTAETISDISGRGVGLDVVKTTIESLGGSITIHSTEGQGSIFSVQLPLTLSIISVMLVEVEEEKFAIPLSSIIETAIVKDEEILHAHNQRVIDFRGKVVPLVFLNETFDVKKENTEDIHSVIIVRKGEKLAGLVVDSFIGQQEVVLKSLGDYLGNVFAISGATILGDGQVALIVDCNALIQ
ncbi:chemotaxis protein histidine kinase [Jeotgalibacillus alimentarius]|uniref:Chemotaxis protein CheA n=1 Tax=Jeotgalibacillus alimentarius TaxID=135826 RepID=A0A0C2VNK8_9BACL|nr:chemotaxis protein CheA [Jeotgalibacillus alimentarius]KIL50492.1 chemotaxis protein histidine kinase [Jeotgalibacillus alimentarius]